MTYDTCSHDLMAEFCISCSNLVFVLLFQVVNELASSAGLQCNVDPTLCNALRTLKIGAVIVIKNSDLYISKIHNFHLMSSLKTVFCKIK